MSKLMPVKTMTGAERAEKLSASTRKIFAKRDNLYRRLAQANPEEKRDSSRKG